MKLNYIQDDSRLQHVPILLGEIFKLSGKTRLLYDNISMMLLVSGIWIS